MKIVFKKFKKEFLIITVLAFLASLFIVLANLSFSMLLNSLIDNSTDKVVQSFMVITILWIISIILNYVYGLYKWQTIERINNFLRTKISNKISTFDIENFQNNPRNEYFSWYVSDINQIEENTFLNLFDLIYLIFSIIISFFSIVYISYILAIVSVILIIFVVYLPMKLEDALGQKMVNLSRTQEKFSNRILDTISGFEEFKLNNLMQRYINLIDSYSTNLEYRKKDYKKNEELTFAIVSLLSICAQLILTFGAMLLILYNYIAIGNLLSIGNISGTFFNSIASAVSCAMIVKPSLRIVNKFIDNTKSDKEFTANDFKILDSIETIKLENIRVKFTEEPIISNFNQYFYKNKKYAIVGESGTGKSTLMNILMGINNNFTGVLKVNDRDINFYNLEDYWRHIYYIRQDAYIFNASLRNNITLFDYDIVDDERIKSLLSKVGLSKYVDQLDLVVDNDSNNLSGGERQRIILARALYKKPSIIFMDESTSALDSKSTQEIENYLIKNTNITLVMISHHLSNNTKNLLDSVINI